MLRKNRKLGPSLTVGVEAMAGAWKETANRGFYYGPKTNNAWNNDIGWKNNINRENRIAAK
jgi:hypothetical protein